MNDRPTVYLYVNGILTVPGSDNWTGRAVTFTHTRSRNFAEKVEYLSGATITRSLFEKARAEKLRRTLGFYLPLNWNIVLVGHSNGCDVILDALAEMNWPRIHALHLFSAACEADCDKNGLNSPRAQQAIRSVNVYVAGKDWAMSFAGSLGGKLFGYGTLGRTGPLNAARPVNVIKRPDFGHGTWFEADEFESTMNAILMAG